MLVKQNVLTKYLTSRWFWRNNSVHNEGNKFKIYGKQKSAHKIDQRTIDEVTSIKQILLSCYNKIVKKTEQDQQDNCETSRCVFPRFLREVPNQR